MFVFCWLNLKVLCTDLWNLFFEIGLNEKKDNIFTWQQNNSPSFNALSSNFPQMITNLTEDTKLAFTERLERLCMIIILLIMLLSHVLNESNSNFAVEISYELMNVLSHFPNFISLQKFFPMQPLSFNCSIFKNKDFSKQCNGFFPLKLAKNWLIKTNFSLLWVSHFIDVLCFIFDFWTIIY